MFDFWLVQPVAAAYVAYPLLVMGGMDFGPSLPPIGQSFAKIVAWFVMSDTYFYWAHRACHTWPWIYRNIHKKHHVFTTPIPIAATYAHPVEAALVNFPTLVLPVILLPSHFLVFLTYMLLSVWEVLESHCGYDFPWSLWRYVRGSANFHDFHVRKTVGPWILHVTQHSHNVGNYGTLTYTWDKLLGTDK
eukprot:CAMPEP_0175968784 /NCGR_PEP_ID=MMETSP0108-20121206/40094_1 /TAXON_ID=195067 ORGANISM="Goniomonas pacifica, Strain CCMP1869" /NCGR_SAMPLE_ID=MMETSP0108 /ASSEMBLY_ACC=CAM_ASM_000204 /LENGTH=189 /DNA_ID=CAMNT_0017297485 /DNA_START=179 /DNA_END=745 /DNA_ORIENTATION=-